MPEVQPQPQANPDTNQGRGNRRRRAPRGERNDDADQKDEGGEKKAKGKGEKKIDWAERARRNIPERSLLSEIESSSQKKHEKDAAQAEKEKKDEEKRKAHLDEAGRVDNWSLTWKQQLEEANQNAEENQKMISFLEKQLNKATLIQQRADLIRDLEDAQNSLTQLHGRRADVAGQVHEILEARAAKDEEQEQKELGLQALIRQRDDAKRVLDFTPNDDEAKRAHAELIASVEAKEKDVNVIAEEKEKKKQELNGKKKEMTDAEHALKAARDAKDAAPDDAAAIAALESAEKDFKAKREAFAVAEESADEEQVRIGALEKEWKAADRAVSRKEKDIAELEGHYGELSAHINLADTPLWDPNGSPPPEVIEAGMWGQTKDWVSDKAPKVGLWVEKDVAQTGRVLGGITRWLGEGVVDMLSAAKSYVNHPDKFFGGHKHFFGRPKKDEGGGKKK